MQIRLVHIFILIILAGIFLLLFSVPLLINIVSEKFDMGINIGKIHGTSMYPTITEYDYFLENRQYSEIKVEDIVSFYQKEYFDREKVPDRYIYHTE
ncbi:MAG: hypothetical protein ABIA12_01445 [Candidatus Aenigmatarchaeota archaeon]